VNKIREIALSESKKIIKGLDPEPSFLESLTELPEEDVPCLFSGTDSLREAFFGRGVHFCTIHNGKSGRCSEDCIFCAQSMYHSTKISEYALQSIAQLQSKGLWAAKTPIHRYSIVTSGHGLRDRETEQVAQAMEGLENEDISACVSLGILEENSLQRLATAGVKRYHHNLEAPRSFFPKVCTTHSFEDRIKTLKRASESGLSLCSGGVFGLGESDRQILEMAMELRSLSVDAVPLNFLTPIPGTAAENFDFLTPLRCLKIIALFRYVLPDAEIIVCGGRNHNLGQLQSMMFLAGASGLMTGDYLTTKGYGLEEDLKLIANLGLHPRSKTEHLDF